MFRHAPSRNCRERRAWSLSWVTLSGVVGSLVLTGCSGSQPGPVTVPEAVAPSDTSTGDAVPSDTASMAPEATDATDPSGLGSDSASTAPANRPAPTRKARPAAVTRTAPASTTAVAATPTPTGPNLTTVLAAERAALTAATAVHVVGDVVVEGQTFKVDLNLGANADGTLTSANGVIRVRRVGKNVFLNVDAAFFVQNNHPELAVSYQGMWMPIDPADPAYAVLAKVTKVATWTTLVAGAPAATAAEGDVVGGTATVALIGGTGSQGTTVLVPAAGTALPLLARSTDHVDQITFDGWNTAAPSVTAPTALKTEPDDTLVDIPGFATETASAFSQLWVTTIAKGL